MATVPGTTPKSNRAYYAHLYGQAGALTKVNSTIYFLADTGAITVIESVGCPFLTILGEIGLADTQQMCDRLQGGAAAICTTRAMEVA
jgi:hypothetical protein